MNSVAGSCSSPRRNDTCERVRNGAEQRSQNPTERADAMKTSELVTIAMFPSVAQAQVAQGVLDEVGIESLIQSDNAGGMYPALDAAALLVRADDAAAAAQSLN